MSLAFIGLGANLERPLQNLQHAVLRLAQTPAVTVTATSPVYRSEPLGPQEQPDYHNAVIACGTSLAPLQLLDTTQSIENHLGRVRSQHWGPRVIDLDILLIDGLEITEERLTVPHYAMRTRNFVLRPLADLVGEDFQLPGGEVLGTLLADCQGALEPANYNLAFDVPDH